MGFRTVLCGACVALALLLLPAVASATYPGKNGRIAVSAQAASGQCFIIALATKDGGIDRVTQPEPRRADCEDDTDPYFSPSGHSLVYSHGDFGSSLRTIRAGGGNMRSDLTPTGIADNPIWRPNGTIAYSFYDFDANDADSYVIPADQRRDRPRRRGRFLSERQIADVSPNGKRYLAVTPGGNILLLDRVGDFLGFVTHGPAYETGPAFSPDGKRVLFVRHRSRDSAASAMFVKRLGGGRARRVIGLRFGLLAGAVFSPNGNWIAFCDRRREGYAQGVFAVLLRNTKRVRVVADRTRTSECDPTWQRR